MNMILGDSSMSQCITRKNLVSCCLSSIGFFGLYLTPKKVATTSLHEQSIYFLIYEPTDDFNDFVAGNTLIFLNFVISLYE